MQVNTSVWLKIPAGPACNVWKPKSVNSRHMENDLQSPFFFYEKHSKVYSSVVLFTGKWSVKIIPLNE